MPTTSPWNIPYPDGPTNLTALQSHFANIATAVNAALTTGLGGAPRIATSDSMRASLFPAPIQGDSVVRPDKGYTEQYYALYNASTNPSGAAPAGWYSQFEQNSAAVLTQYVSPGVSIPNTNTYTVTRSGSFTLERAGRIQLFYHAQTLNPTNMAGFIVIKINGAMAGIGLRVASHGDAAPNPWTRVVKASVPPGTNSFEITWNGETGGGPYTVANQVVEIWRD